MYSDRFRMRFVNELLRTPPLMKILTMPMVIMVINAYTFELKSGNNSKTPCKIKYSLGSSVTHFGLILFLINCLELGGQMVHLLRLGFCIISILMRITIPVTLTKPQPKWIQSVAHFYVSRPFSQRPFQSHAIFLRLSPSENFPQHPTAIRSASRLSNSRINFPPAVHVSRL